MNPSSPAHRELLAIEVGSRANFVESRLVAWITAARSPEAPPFDAATQISDLGIDSLQLVDIKFELDDMLGKELDVALFISNPTIRELARESLRVCGL
jgi:acyl carrier protein